MGSIPTSFHLSNQSLYWTRSKTKVLTVKAHSDELNMHELDHENEPTSSRDALDLLLSGSQDHARSRGWQVLALNTQTAAHKSTLTARQHSGCDQPVMVHCFRMKSYLHPCTAADARTTKNATDPPCWCEDEE